MKLLRLGVFMAMAVAVAAVVAVPAGASPKRAGQAQDKAAFCNKVKSGQLQVSSGARMFCFGSQPNGPKASVINSAGTGASPGGLPNHDAGNPLEDQVFGTQFYGQSETAIAASNQYGVEAWNDATGFAPAPPCYSDNTGSFKDQLTGIGFTRNYGGNWQDLGGLPNFDCDVTKWFGDASVQPYTSGGTKFFYISSLIGDLVTGSLLIAVEPCWVDGSSLECTGYPIYLNNQGGGVAFEDKDFMAIDQARGLLYITYADFTVGDDIVLNVCDLNSDPFNPTCYSPYLTLDSSSGCNELEGAYPAVDQNTGDVYVAYEDNWATNLFDCAQPTFNDVVHVPQACLTLPAPSCGVADKQYVEISSMDGAFIPGYNRFPMNDFPRIAVSDTAPGPTGSVAIVWNDARFHSNGDILMQRFYRDDLDYQGGTSVVNTDNSGAFHMLPAIGTSGGGVYGSYQVQWYDRRNFGPNSAKTDVFARLGLGSGPTKELKVTNQATDWNAVSSDIVPNFGDYTDLYVASNTGVFPHRVWFAWSDGRQGLPQPWNATQPIK